MTIRRLDVILELGLFATGFVLSVAFALLVAAIS
jgi:hypothetical protein